MKSSGTITRNLIVTKPYTSIMFNETAASHGLGKLAIANQKFENGSIVSAEYITKLFNNVLGKDTSQEEIAYPFENIVFKSSNDSVLSVETTANGVKFIVKDTGEVTVTAEWIYGERFGVKPASFTFNAVNGTYVKDYDELKRQPLSANKSFCKRIFTSAKNLPTNRATRSTPKRKPRKIALARQKIKTTSDYKYYTNLGQEQPDVYVCFEFENDVFGNGHFISAEYITNLRGALTDTVPAYALFKGPLNFVAANMGGIDVASVKAQDNISFLVRKTESCLTI